MKTFLANNWRWLALAAGILLALAVLTQATEYGRALLAKHGLVKQQAQATAQHQQRQQASSARYQKFQLDSVKRATEAQAMLREIHQSQQRDAQLDKNRPARVYLPAEPPKEQ